MSKQLKLPTLLIVTDNASVRYWIKKHLDEEFFIIYAENSAQAISGLDAKLDFIIVDSHLKEDAIALCKELHSRTIKQLTPIFLITGRLKKAYREKASLAGVKAFLSDQLDLEEFLSLFEKGAKAVGVREKTEAIGKSIQAIRSFDSNSLKDKFILNDKALTLLNQAKKQNVPVASLFIQFDQNDNLEEKKAALLKLLSSWIRVKDVLVSHKEGIVLLLLNAPLEKANLIAQRLKAKIAKEPQMLALEITVSIAVSSFQADEKSFHKMLHSAVKSLKAQNESGLIISIEEDVS